MKILKTLTEHKKEHHSMNTITPSTFTKQCTVYLKLLNFSKSLLSEILLQLVEQHLETVVTKRTNKLCNK